MKDRAERKAKFYLALIFSSLFLLVASFLWSLPSDSIWARVEIISLEKTPANLAILASFSEPPDFLLETSDRIYLVARPQELTSFQSAGLFYRLETSLFPPARPRLSELFLASGGNGAYHSYQELTHEMKSLAEKFPFICRLEEIGRSLEGRSILALKISDRVELDEAEPAFLFLGCHHAREWISVEVPFYLGRYLVENYNQPLIHQLVNEAQIWIVPLVNPDGLEYSIKFYRYWRKNRRLNSDGSFGVDLNRNYGFKWGVDNRGSSPNPSSETYRGPAPFSEPETRAVRDLFLKYPFQALISYHSYSQIILFPWGYTTAPPDKYQLLFTLAGKMSELMLSVNGRRYAYGQASTMLYLTNGDTTDWAYGLAGIPAFTIELPPVDILQGGFFNAESDIQTVFEENLKAALDLIQWGISNYHSSAPLTRNNKESIISLISRNKKR